MILVANKADLDTDRVVTKQEGEELAQQYKVCAHQHVDKYGYYVKSLCSFASSVYRSNMSKQVLKFN